MFPFEATLMFTSVQFNQVHLSTTLMAFKDFGNFQAN